MSFKFNFFELSLRVASMLGKFILLVFITKASSLEQVGIYGIFITSIVLINYVQGLEFHSFSTRELLGRSGYHRSYIVGNKLILFCISYALFLPFTLILFFKSIIPWELCYLFYGIAILTHLGQEAQRLLIVLSKIRNAYIVSFLVHGLWAYIACLLIYFGQLNTDLGSIFVLWMISGLIGLAYGSYYLKTEHCFEFSKHFSVDRKWILQGLRVSAYFFIGVLSYKIIELSDRYFISYFHGDEQVGIYTIYASVSNFAIEAIYTGIIVGIFPLMLASFNSGDIEKYTSYRNTLIKRVAYGTVLVFVLLVVLMYVVLIYIDRQILIDDFSIFIVLLIGVSIVNLSQIPNYILYVNGRDKVIMWSVVIGMALNVLLNFLLIPTLGISGAAWATLFSFLLVAVIKYYYSKELN